MRLDKDFSVDASRGRARIAGLRRRTQLDDGDAGADPMELARFASSLDSLEARHLHAIRKLAEEEHWPVKDVRRLYGLALQELGTGARIQDYLVLLTSKKVRSAIRQCRNDASQSVSTIPAGQRGRPHLRTVASR